MPTVSSRKKIKHKKYFFFSVEAETDISAPAFRRLWRETPSTMPACQGDNVVFLRNRKTPRDIQIEVRDQQPKFHTLERL